jgi:hypothetical protein
LTRERVGFCYRGLHIKSKARNRGWTIVSVRGVTSNFPQERKTKKCQRQTELPMAAALPSHACRAYS